MGRLTSEEWWWEFALDGVVGGVIGGLFTAFAVLLTLRHEKERSLQQREFDTLQIARRAASRLTGETSLIGVMQTDRDVSDFERRRQLAAMLSTSQELCSLAATRWPQFGDDVDAATRAITDAMDFGQDPTKWRKHREEAVWEAVSRLHHLIEEWMAAR